MSTPTLSILADSSQIRTATKDLQSLSNAGGQTQTAVNKTSDAVKRFSAEMTTTGRSISSTNKVIGFMGQEIESATRELQGLIAESNKSNAVLSNVENNLTKLTTASKSAAASASAFANALTTVNQDLGEARNNIENFISDQIKLGRTIDENGNVISASGNKIDALSDDLQRLRSEYLNTSNQSDELADAMNRINLATDKNQAAAYEARLKQMALADAAQDVAGSLKSQASAMNKVETEYSRLVAQANSAGDATVRAGGAMRSLGRNAGQAGIQVQQFVGQIQGGQSALLALSQQGADLGFVLGAPLVGAVVGIGASLVSFLIPALINSAEETETLKDKLIELSETQLLTAEQAAFLADIENDSIEEKKKLRKETAKQIEIVKAGIRNQEIAIEKNVEQEGTIKRLKEANEESNKELRKLQSEYQLLSTEIDKSEDRITAYGLATETVDGINKKSNKSTANLTTSLQAQIIALQSGAQAAEVYAATQAAVANGTEAQLPKIIELINQKYELKRAQEAAAESAKLEIEQQKAYESVLDSIFKNQERINTQKANDEKQRQASFEGLKQQIILQQAQLQLDNDQYELRRNLLALGDGANQSQIDEITALTEQMQRLRFESELLGPSLQQSFGDIGNSAITSFSDGLANSLLLGEDFNETIKGLTANILTGLLSAVIEYGTRQAAMYALDAAGFTAAEATKTAAVTAAVGTQAAAATAATGTVAAAQVAAAGTITAAMAPAAAATSVATAGAAPAAAAPIALGSIATIIAALVGGVALGATVFGRATGGQVSRNTPYLVGERGPELFTPNSSGGGRITPFNQLMNQAGQSNSNTVVDNTTLNLNLQGTYNSAEDMIINNRDLIVGIITDYKRRKGEAF